MYFNVLIYCYLKQTITTLIDSMFIKEKVTSEF